MDEKTLRGPIRDRLMRIQELTEVTGLSRSKLYELMQQKQFVPTIVISPRCVAWSANAVQEWIQKRAAASSGSQNETRSQA